MSQIVSAFLRKIIQTRILFSSKERSSNYEVQNLIIDNKKNHAKHWICARPVVASKKRSCYIETRIQQVEGVNQCVIKILDKKLRLIQKVPPNRRVYLQPDSSLFFITISAPPKSKHVIEYITINDMGLTKDKAYKRLFNSDTLLITPCYPSEENKYSCAFVHSRMKAYKKAGLDVALVVVNQENTKQAGTGNYEDIDIVYLGYDGLRNLLHKKCYSKILIHFFDEKYAQILDAVDTSNTMIYLFSHGADTMYWDYGKIARRYFQPPTPIEQYQKELFFKKDNIIKKYNNLPNVKWVFVTDFTLTNSQKLLGMKYNNACVIPCLVDEQEFFFTKRNPETRRKICVIRKFDDISSYSIDTVVRVILELSRRKFFKDLGFSIFGDGSLHDFLLAPIKSFSNVHIQREFLSHREMATMYNKHGIALFPSRYDSQAVASCEAAMTGAVVITSKGTGVVQFIDPKLGTYCDTEDIKAYANLIEKLYYNEKLFLELGPKMHNSVLKTCGFNQTIAKDIKLITSESTIKPLNVNFKAQIKEPIITVAVPAYNVGSFLRNGVISLLNHPLAHKIEVLIVNDGSTDNTALVAKELEKLTATKNGKSIVKLINKTNGGHGSAINAGIDAARGKYFRLMDGDDYFDTEQFVQLLEKLEHETADIVLTNYVEDLSIAAEQRPVRHYEFMEPGLQYDLDQMHHKGYGFGSWGPLLSTTTVKTKILQNANFKIDENCFYVDMEYNLIIYILAKNVVYYPLDIYIYYLQRSGQSMNKQSFIKNYSHHEKVCLRLLKEFNKYRETLSTGKQQYIINKLLIPMCRTQYEIAIEYFNNSKAFLSFNKKLKSYPEFYENFNIAGRIVRVHRLTRGKIIFANDGMVRILGFLKKIKNKVRP